MCNWGRCFLCLVTILPGRAVAAKSRTAVPVWIDRVLCTPCAKRVEGLGELVVVCQDEWHTVRLGGVVDDAIGIFEEDRSP